MPESDAELWMLDIEYWMSNADANIIILLVYMCSVQCTVHVRWSLFVHRPLQRFGCYCAVTVLLVCNENSNVCVCFSSWKSTFMHRFFFFGIV